MAFEDTKIVILAAGKGKRMGLEIPKVLVPIQGRPMLAWLLEAVESAEVDGPPVVVYGPGLEEICTFVGARGHCTLQAKQLGTAHAVLAAKDALAGAKRLVVMYGDVPFISARAIRKIVEYHIKKPCPIMAAVGVVESYTGWQRIFQQLGRIMRDEDGLIHAIREAKDATEEELRIREINAGFYVFDAEWLWNHIENVQNKNAQEEYYLTDVIAMAVSEGLPVRTYQIPIEECIGINKLEERDVAEVVAQQLERRLP
ncbi:NTP transferase domain-containing protein [Candidatus Uhrbacteria bacterium]|nr:NTP transferase domain-containing protein [Candidatus Uhrbacteria bacterium]